MNAYAVFAVNEHLEYLLAEAAQRRLLQTHKPSLRQRIVSATQTVRTTLKGATNTGTLLSLDESPYRG